MKKIMAVLTILMCFASTSVFAQEVRGIETRRAVYNDGTQYEYKIGTERYANSTSYYGWEFTNRNSCSVSVDITLLLRGYVITTKSIVLEAGEKYLFKFEGVYETRYYCNANNNREYFGNQINIDDYYVEYKAYKLQ